MNITLKLFATLTDYLPADSRYTNIVELEVADGATITQVIEPYHLPSALVHLVLVNGRYVAADQRASEVLAQGDVLAIWPPIAGG
ncbi:MAG: MoaD/ThiS family protein [Burkholderiales bacterium]